MSESKRLDREIEFDESIPFTTRETVFTVANIKLLWQRQHDGHNSDGAISFWAFTFRLRTTIGLS